MNEKNKRNKDIYPVKNRTSINTNRLRSDSSTGSQCLSSCTCIYRGLLADPPRLIRAFAMPRDRFVCFVIHSLTQIYMNNNLYYFAMADPEGPNHNRLPPGKNHNLLYISIIILIRTPFRGRFIRPKIFRTSSNFPDPRMFFSCHDTRDTRDFIFCRL